MILGAVARVGFLILGAVARVGILIRDVAARAGRKNAGSNDAISPLLAVPDLGGVGYRRCGRRSLASGLLIRADGPGAVQLGPSTLNQSEPDVPSSQALHLWSRGSQCGSIGGHDSSVSRGSGNSAPTRRPLSLDTRGTDCSRHRLLDPAYPPSLGASNSVPTWIASRSFVRADASSYELGRPCCRWMGRYDRNDRGAGTPRAHPLVREPSQSCWHRPAGYARRCRFPANWAGFLSPRARRSDDGRRGMYRLQLDLHLSAIGAENSAAFSVDANRAHPRVRDRINRPLLRWAG